MIINRVWAMPNKWTFQIPPIAELLARYVGDGKGWIDPFAGATSPAEITNDAERDDATFRMDALEFAHHLARSPATGSFAGVLFDPPYSVEQCLRRYTPKFKGTAGRAEYWARCKDTIAVILAQGAIGISFCWDSTGFGVNRGFVIEEILLVCHGACHNDTIVTVERKIQSHMAVIGSPAPPPSTESVKP
jgi:hypothetical protein